QAYILFSQYDEADHSELLVYDIEEGEELWKVSVKGNHVRCPLIIPETKQVWVCATYSLEEILEGKTAAYITAIDLDSQDILFEIPVENQINGELQYANGSIYCKSIHWEKKEEGGAISETSTITKIDVKTGEILWEKTLPLSGLADCGMPTIKNEYVYVAGYATQYDGEKVRTSGNASLICLREDTGEVVWSKSFEGYDRICSPSADDTQAYCIVHKGMNDKFYEFECVALNAKTGETKWSFAKKGLDARNFTPKLSTDTVIITADYGYIFALDKQDGNVLWDKRIMFDDYYINFYCPGMIIAGNTLVFSCYHYVRSGMLYDLHKKILMLSMENGRTLEKLELDDDFSSYISLAVYGKGIMLLDSKNNLSYIEASMPELTIQPKEVDFGSVEQGESVTKTITIRNSAHEGLSGTISILEEASWLTIEPTVISDETKEIVITANTDGLSLKDYHTWIEICSNGGNKRIPITIKVVDSTPPEVILQTDSMRKIDDWYYTNQNPYLLKGTTEPDAALWINDKEIEISPQGSFQIEISLQEGENKIEINAKDAIGNTTTILCKIMLDTNPPSIEVENENYQLFTSSEGILKGITKDCCELTINDEIVKTEENGDFSVQVALQPEINEFVLKAVDYAGNTTTVYHYLVLPEKKIIILQIGNVTAEVNGELFDMDVPACIRNGSTLVPLRFIAEAFGAEIDYESETRKITYTLYGTRIVLWVGKPEAQVNDVSVALSQVPIVIEGRTVIPVRFVSENLGAKVGWDGSTQKVYITFPNPDM
ncbi:MAG TPA: stalk domain-containing protein, partial [Caldisericia bacterium]|nr:stalk domain-containing protein [Caldisericia bacterium]